MARFDCAAWRDWGKASTAMSSTLGVLMHQQVGNGSLFGFFSNPSTQVSAHFWVAKSGAVEQYVDTNYQAWHARDLNANYAGIEFEGFPDEALTPGQLTGGAMILEEGSRRHGWPIALCESKGARGFGYHRLPGSSNGAGGSHPTACPSDLRLSQRPAIVDLARGAGQVPPEIPAYGKERNMIARNTKGAGYWAVRPEGNVYAFHGAPYLGPAPKYLAAWGIGTPANPVVGIADDGNGGFELMADDGKYPGAPGLYHIEPDARYAE